jgi:hypothetical protein
LNMQSMQARFATQDQAESVMRKLASLRSDCFRLERAGHYADSEASSLDYSPTALSLSSSVIEGTVVNPAEEFMLSANVPDAAKEQARNVIMQAGGQVI